MKADILKIAAIMLIVAGSLASCTNKMDNECLPAEDPENEMNDTIYSNIDNLYEQPLSVLRKCVEGKWKWYVQFGGAIGIYYPKNTFVDIKNDYMVIDYDDGDQRQLYFTWKECSTVDNIGEKYKKWVIWDNERDKGIWYFNSIKNDTLSVGDITSPDATFEQFSSIFTRVK